MKKWVTTAALVVMSVVTMRADVTFVQTMTVEGAAAAMMGSAQMPRITMRIKGQKSRADIEVNGQTISSITDLESRQIIILNSETKTATVTTPGSSPTDVPMPKIDASFKSTGKSQVIEGQQCDEHALTLRMNMSEISGAQLPPEAVAMMKDVQMVFAGSIWTAPSAPGAAEYSAFTKAALSSNLFAALAGMAGGSSGGLDKLMEAAASAPGLPYLTDMTMTFEGSGQMVDMMKQMGPMRMVQKISGVSTDAVAATAFEIPSDYKVDKK